jgi:mRNA interferase RelE/StbE
MASSSGLAALMHYRLDFSEEAREELRALPREHRRRIGQKLDAIQTDLQGDVKKLEGQKIKYRLRVGTYRLLFTLEKDLIFIHGVKDRKDAYHH